MLISSVLTLAASMLGVDTVTQTDWSGGPSAAAPVVSWNSRFESSTGISWRSIPGQIALSSTPLNPSVQHPLAGNQTVAGGVHAADIDGDGDIDVVSAQYLSLQWWERLGNGTWTSHPIVNNFYGMGDSYVTTADLDHDGDTDIIVATYYGPPQQGEAGRVSWFENLNGVGTSWKTRIVEPQFYGANRVIVADIDGDGDLDLVSDAYLAYSIPGQDDDVIWLENVDGHGETWIHHSIDADYMDVLAVDVADIDGDGDLDVFGSGAGLPQSDPQTIVWWENQSQGKGPWIRRTIIPFFSFAHGATAVDMDGDGDPDVVAASYDFNQIQWFENVNPFTSPWPAHPIANLGHVIDIRLADIDGDGDIDVLGYSAFNNNQGVIMWAENAAGNGSTWTTHTVATGLDYPTADAGDINSDGKLEVIATRQGLSQGDGALSWWDVTHFSSPGMLTSSILDGAPGNSGGGDSGGPQWDTIAFDVALPTSTFLQVEVRAGNDPASLGGWAMVRSSGASLANLVDPTARYLQYRMTLSSSDDAAAPIVHSLSVTMQPRCPADIDDSGAVGVPDLLAVINGWGPCNGCAADIAPIGAPDLQVNASDLLLVINSWGTCP